jgi:hypothetical protein
MKPNGEWQSGQEMPSNLARDWSQFPHQSGTEESREENELREGPKAKSPIKKHLQFTGALQVH